MHIQLENFYNFIKNDKTINNPNIILIFIDSPCITALKLREGDKLAKEFMKKLKQKLPS